MINCKRNDYNRVDLTQGCTILQLARVIESDGNRAHAIPLEASALTKELASQVLESVSTVKKSEDYIPQQ